MDRKRIIPVILCGGSGSRLWPLSRQSFPKQFLNLNFTNNSLLQQTYLRTKKLKNIEKPILICNEQHRFIVAEQMREINIKPNSIILEPFGRNTAPAIALAALKALEISDDPHILILSSDHQIDNEEKFVEVIEKSIEISEKGKLITFGIVPTSPEIGYGYIKAAEKLDQDKIKGSNVDSFVEKPDKRNAENFIKDKNLPGIAAFLCLKQTLFWKRLKSSHLRL